MCVYSDQLSHQNGKLILCKVFFPHVKFCVDVGLNEMAFSDSPQPETKADIFVRIQRIFKLFCILLGYLIV